MDPARKASDELLQYIDNSPSPFHAVSEAIKTLDIAQSQSLQERDTWNLEPGKLYHLSRNGSSLVAFRLPLSPGPNLHFHIIGAHTDSPCLKLKPKPAAAVANYSRWGVEVYGGALLNSWLDRDLYLSGRISGWQNGKQRQRLLRLERSRFRIPQLAIHLDREVNDKGLVLNKQTQLVPVMGLTQGEGREMIHYLRDGLESADGKLHHDSRSMGKTGDEEMAFWDLCLEQGDFALDMCFHIAQPSAYGGLKDEFIYAPRLDNLAMCQAALAALIPAKAHADRVQLVALFDNEEIGSQSAQGAFSSFLGGVLERICLALEGDRTDFLASMSRSRFVSSDMAHALHPNYPEKHEPDHRPLLNRGLVIKTNSNLRYATQSDSSAYFKGLCRKEGVPYQDFITRSDLACGTTIGPLVSSATGISTVDIGSPMLSMHSSREMAGSRDQSWAIQAFRAHFEWE